MAASLCVRCQYVRLVDAHSFQVVRDDPIDTIGVGEGVSYYEAWAPQPGDPRPSLEGKNFPDWWRGLFQKLEKLSELAIQNAPHLPVHKSSIERLKKLIEWGLEQEELKKGTKTIAYRVLEAMQIHNIRLRENRLAELNRSLVPARKAAELTSKLEEAKTWSLFFGQKAGKVNRFSNYGSKDKTPRAIA